MRGGDEAMSIEVVVPHTVKLIPTAPFAFDALTPDIPRAASIHTSACRHWLNPVLQASARKDRANGFDHSMV